MSTESPFVVGATVVELAYHNGRPSVRGTMTIAKVYKNGNFVCSSFTNQQFKPHCTTMGGWDGSPRTESWSARRTGDMKYHSNSLYPLTEELQAKLDEAATERLRETVQRVAGELLGGTQYRRPTNKYTPDQLARIVAILNEGK